VYEIPEAGRAAKGKSIANFIQLSEQGEKITAAIPVDAFDAKGGKETFLFMGTEHGTVKKTPLSEFSNPRRGGIIAIKLDDEDSLIGVKHTDGKSQVIIGTREGLAIRFEEEEVRPIGRAGMGVRGIKLEKGDRVVGMEAVGSKDTILIATENGYGKRTDIDEYRLQSRGGHGVINIKTTDRNGPVVGLIKANDGDDVMIMTAKGMSIRLPAKEVSIIGRNAQGVRLVRQEEDDKLAAITPLAKEDEEEDKQEQLPLKKP
jgi:DNA gyrase subunit A